MDEEKKEPTLEEVDKEAEEQPAPEELDKVDVGIGSDYATEIAAQERASVAVAYQRLAIRAQSSRRSIIANRSAKNQEAADKFVAEERELGIQMAHALRAIKEIDLQYPKAKARMKELLAADYQKAQKQKGA